MLNRWNFLKPGFYEGIKVAYLLLGDYVTLAPQLEGIYPGGDYREIVDSDGGLIAASYTLGEVRN